MNSKLLLLFVIAGLIVISYNVHAFAEPGDLLFTIENPGLKKDMFSSSLGTINDLIIVGASAKEVDGVAFAGSLYVFDGATGKLKFTIENPDPKRGDRFGRNMITTDNYIVVGLDVENKSDVGHKGKIFVFDDMGLLLFTIENPNGPVYDGWFADKISSYGDKIIAGSNFQDSDGKWIYMVHIFDESGNLQYTLEDFESNTNTFGYSVSSFGENIAVYVIDEDANDDIHTNSVHVFDATSGEFQYVIENPDPTKGDFGRHIVEVQGNLVVGTPTHMWDEEISGTIYAFDDKGTSSFSIKYPESNISNVNFGGYLTAVGNNIALRSISDQTDHDYFNPLSDVFYVFDGETGDQLLVIEESGLQDENGRSFIQYLEGDGNFVISGLNRSGHNPLQKIVYVFEGIMPEAVLANVSRDDAPFFGIFVYLDDLISWIFGNTGNNTVGEKKDLIDDDKTIIDKYKDLPEVVAFYAEYENAQVSVRKDHISYFVGSEEDYLLRMNLEFNENYEIENKEFHCYYKKTPKWEMSQEDIVSNLAIYDCGQLKSSSEGNEKLDLQKNEF